LSKRLSATARREVIERAATEVFAERGYQGASIDEIARRSQVSAPVIYDHFASKVDLYRRLLERHRDELLALWREHLVPGAPPRRALEAWARYVEEHPFAWRMLFRETTGDAAATAAYREVHEDSRGALADVMQADDAVAELARSGLTGLAIWWQDHPEVTREQIVATAMNVLWLGLERLARGERWDASEEPHRERERDQRHPDEQRQDDPDGERL
jgi:AcrR family transcriptional regulator